MNEAIAKLQPYAEYASHPLALLALFLAASCLMIWRLNAIERKGFEGTVVGTLIMPYCSGAPNLAFAYVMARGGDAAQGGRLLMENAIVNNVTNLTLVLGVAALLGTAAQTARAKKAAVALRLDRLDLLLTLVALFLFTGVLWALGRDRTLDRNDALVLIALFVFWQVLHVFEILKNNLRKNQRPHWSIAFDLLLVGACAWAVYSSVDHLVQWVETAQNRVFSMERLGWLSGLLTVLPNALLAVYYARAGRPDIVVTSQVGDAHICIPMCVGLFALFSPIHVPGYFEFSMALLLAAGAVHFLCTATIGRLPAPLGWALIGTYAGFMYAGVFR